MLCEYTALYCLNIQYIWICNFSLTHQQAASAFDAPGLPRPLPLPRRAVQRPATPLRTPIAWHPLSRHPAKTAYLDRQRAPRPPPRPRPKVAFDGPADGGQRQARRWLRGCTFGISHDGI